jgi:membrane-bound serine protease (ClpP class)
MAELHGAGMGIGLGWLVSGVCFAMFFWSRFLGGTAGWLEVVLFVAGASCLALELLVLPGFGLFGLAGGVLVLTSLILASQTFYFLPQNEYQTWRLTKSLLMLFGSGVGVTALGALMRYYLPQSPLFNRMVLAPPTAEELAASTAEAAALAHAPTVGQRGKTVTPLVPSGKVPGKTVTPLVPSGKVRVGDRLVDVVADGGFIERGADVVVSEVMGNKIVVKLAPGSK